MGIALRERGAVIRIQAYSGMHSVHVNLIRDSVHRGKEIKVVQWTTLIAAD